MCVCVSLPSVLMGDVCEEYVQVYMCMSVIVTRVLVYKHVKVTVLMTVMTQFIYVYIKSSIIVYAQLCRHTQFTFLYNSNHACPTTSHITAHNAGGAVCVNACIMG